MNNHEKNNIVFYLGLIFFAITLTMISISFKTYGIYLYPLSSSKDVLTELFPFIFLVVGILLYSRLSQYEFTRLFLLIVLQSLWVQGVQGSDDFTSKTNSFLASIPDTPIYPDPVKEKQFRYELEQIRYANQSRQSGESLHTPEVVTHVRRQLELEKRLGNDTSPLDPTKDIVELCLPEESLKENREYLDYYNLLIVRAKGGVLTEGGMVISMACGFWLVGFSDLQNFYRYDNNVTTSRVDFMFHEFICYLIRL